MMRFRGVLITLGLGAAWLIGWVYYAQTSNNTARQQVQQATAIRNNPSVPPVLSDRMADPNWTIAYWMDVGKKSSDCTTADEYMDRNATSRTVTRRGTSKTYYLKDYIASCQNRVTRTLGYVEPQAQKWCTYRRTSARLETLCREWEQNKSAYLARINAADGPTLRRYQSFIGR